MRIIVPRAALADVSCRLRKNANQSIPHNVITAVTWQLEDYDTDGFFSAAQPTRITIPATRKYALAACNNWVANAVGFRRGFFRLNGVTNLGITTIAAVGVAGISSAYVIVEEHRFVAGDFLELMVQQDSGAALNLSNNQTFWAIHALPKL